MAASTKMSFSFYQNGKYGTLPQNTNKDMEITQDMHLKMSKKIAQLTKVIYALNTKNDEHEAIVQQLKEQHEEEMQQLLTETRDKIAIYKNKMDTESVHIRKIELLETSVSKLQLHKEQAMSQFESFKRISEDRETRLKKEHSERILDLSQAVLVAKKDFEEKLRQFEAWKHSVSDEHDRNIQDLKSAHQIEIEEVRNYQRNENDDWLNDNKRLEEKYKNELQTLQEQFDALGDEKCKMAEDYEGKLAKAQLFYEKELEALKHSNSADHEETIRRLQEEHEKMKKDFAAQSSELRKQINSLVSQLSAREDEVDKYRTELENLSASLKDKDSSSYNLNMQLQEAQSKASEALARLKEAESELSVIKERCTRQEDEMLKKSTLIGQLEATKLQNETKISDLEGTVNKLVDKLKWLEQERNNLEKQKSSLSHEQQTQLHSLEKALEDLSIEKQTMKERYERDIESLHSKFSKSDNEIARQHQSEMNSLRKQGDDTLGKQKKTSDHLLELTKQELMMKHATELEKLTAERDRIRAEYERVQSELTSRLKAAEDEVGRLNSMVQDSQHGLGSATGVINGLKDANKKLQQQLETAQADYKEEKSRATSLQAELDKLKLKSEAQVRELRIELQQRLERLGSEKDGRWQETLRIECAKLRQEITEQKDNEMRAALQQLASMKDSEIAATRAGWERRVDELMKQIDSLRLNVKDSVSKTQAELDKHRAEAAAERKRLEDELVNAANEYAQKIQTMETSHNEMVRKLHEQNEHEIEKLTMTLKVKHIEDMEAQMTAHKATVTSVRETVDRQRLTDLSHQKQEHETEQDALRSRLHEQHGSEMDRKSREHEAHLGAARMELERAVEISKQKEKDHNMKVEELQGEITQRERHIRNLKEDTTKLQTTIKHLEKEIDFKRQEINKLKSDTQNQLRLKEDQLTKKLEQALDNLQADHLRESQELINQFNQAQEILKDKISELQMALEEAEERYANRESRPEDLELIEQLRDAVNEREERMKQLIDEKKFFQMELVNRETNFNKVFNANPNVGVLNPFQNKVSVEWPLVNRETNFNKVFNSNPNVGVLNPFQNKVSVEWPLVNRETNFNKVFNANPNVGVLNPFQNKKKDKNSPAKLTSSPNLSRLDPLPGSPMHNSRLNPTRPLPQPKKFLR